MTDGALDSLLDKILKKLISQQLPESTYRLQFHSGFRFEDAVRLVPYLQKLGITDCYSSPILKACSGSRHGYDITDHNQLNPEIGSEQEFDELAKALKSRGMGLILDLVPNHMAVVGNENKWWNDVLENGPASPFAEYFDISWTASPRPELQGNVLVPVLGELYGKVLEGQQLQLHYDAGAFSINYFDHRFPVAPRSYGLILAGCLKCLEQQLGTEAPALHEFQSIFTAVKHLPRSSETAPALVAERQREKEIIKRRLAALTTESPDVRKVLDQTVREFNGTPGDPHSFDQLHELLNDQVYRLAYWRVAADEINYRRFFDINELAALSTERLDVFTATHEVLLRLLRRGQITGFRIDHPDGLFDPRQYLQRLQISHLLGALQVTFVNSEEFRGRDWNEVEGRARERISSMLEQKNPYRWPLYVVVEKILVEEETLAEDWPVFGTSGYDFLNLVNGLFVDGNARETFSQLYRDWIGDATSFAELAHQKKILIMQIALSSELQMLSHQLDRLAQRNRGSRDFTLHGLRQALREIIACFPVYRSYIADGVVGERDLRYVVRAVRRAMARNPGLSISLFQFVRDVLMLRGQSPGVVNADYQAEMARFAGKFQQVTAPVMAKGVEDTAFYVFNRLLSLNEVGGDPDRFGVAPAALHQSFQERQARWPWAMSASSTHDTKRSEDVRARINVLSEIPSEWHSALARWREFNRPHRSLVDEESAPDPNEEYFLYQTLLGAWPVERPGQEDFSGFVERIQSYMQKALQEAKVHTSWINPNDAYDEAVRKFVACILDGQTNRPFLDDFAAFQKRISHFGKFNSLAQALLKITAPGVADFYQGTELWDFSLVDPDNRRPVDFGVRERLLDEIQSMIANGEDLGPLARELTETKEDGRIKLFLTQLGLCCRRDHPGLFSDGRYIPLETKGMRKEHVFAFARATDTAIAVVVVPRLLTQLIGDDSVPCGAEVWGDTVLCLESTVVAKQWKNVFTQSVIASMKNSDRYELPVAEVLRNFPAGLLLST